MLWSGALSVMGSIYSFIDRDNKSFRRFSPRLMEELKVLQGLVLVTGQVDLAAPFTGFAFMGDSSSKGYSLS
eukprot:2983351-Karenia_brevis.AAC.1